jgi:hypothetical protein
VVERIPEPGVALALDGFGVKPRLHGGRRLQKRLHSSLRGASPANRKAPYAGACEERMMGLEPTTFCMASRRSSQLSYIRERLASIASAFCV